VKGRLAFAAPAALAIATHAVAQDPAALHRWDLLVGHSYSSPRSLMQPATLVVEKAQGSPLYSVVDAGALVRGSLAERTWLEVGLRARAGSARPSSQRAYGAMARAFHELDPVLVAVGGEYEADGGFDVRTTSATVELTPLGGLPGLGTWVDPTVHLRWRPWIGAAAGGAFRPYARLSADWVQGRVEAGIEETAWVVGGSGRSFLKGDVSVRLVGGLFATASGEIGRPPPTYERTGRVGLGLGFRLGPTT
jgi:hypothetical protein